MKILIYADKNKLKPIGGPYGYLFNLAKGIESENISDIHFLNENDNIEEHSNKPFGIVMNKKVKNSLWIYYYISKALLGNGNESTEDFERYDAIHFHSTVDLYNNRKKLEHYKGRVILTSHSPKAFYLEVLDMMVQANVPFSKLLAKKFENIDRFAFKRCTDIIFPCHEAIEPYLHTWEFFRDNYKLLKDKMHFVITGLSCPDTVQPIKLSFIPNEEERFIVSYVGRHNNIKGYDLLLRAAKKIEKIDPEIVFVAAGKEVPIKHDTNLTNWYELGWTDNPMGLVKASDLFILPNRETYFDIVLIEALASSSVVLISDTGGNKYFRKFNSNSINYFNTEDVDDMVHNILQIKNSGVTKTLREQSRAIYEKEFTPEKFALEYEKTVKSICENLR